MPGPYYVALASGSLSSPAFALERGSRTLVVEVPSLTAAASVRCQFTATSGTAPFLDQFKDDGSGAVLFVSSGIGPAFGAVPNPPTPWGRITVGAAQSAVSTFTLTLRERN